jgi:hypothetical protein
MTMSHSPANLLRRPYLSFAVEQPRPPLPRRALAALDAPRLDRALAAGIDPERRPALAARAASLRSRRRRRMLAAGLEHAVGAAARPHGLSPQASVARRDVLLCAPLMLGLADRLRSEQVLGVAGIAQVALLLTDALSPLYAPTTRTALRDALDDAADGMGVLTGS